MRYELTINTKYVPKWKTWEGIREIIQNALDGDEDGYPIRIHKGKRHIKVTNEGLRLKNAVLLSGTTTKAYRKDQRGQWGEGLKLGLLALLREGVKVEIHNGNEKWIPSLEYSEVFEDDNGPVEVLVINTEELKSCKYDFTVRVEIGAAQWDVFSRLVLLLRDDVKELKANKGSVLLNKEFCGNVFCGGIWVCKKHELDFGYDFDSLTLDRDRMMPEDFDLQYQMGEIWAQLFSDAGTKLKNGSGDEKKEALSHVEKVFRLLETERLDMRYFKTNIVNCGHRTVFVKVLADMFRERYDGAYPVNTLHRFEVLQNLGIKGKQVGDTLYEVLEMHFGDFDDMRKKLMRSKEKRVQVIELFEDEQKILMQAVVLLSAVLDRPVKRLLETIEVVEFSNAEMCGLCSYLNGKYIISIGRSELKTFKRAITTLVHEYGHTFKGADDATRVHSVVCEELWGSILEMVAFKTDFWGKVQEDVEGLIGEI